METPVAPANGARPDVSQCARSPLPYQLPEAPPPPKLPPPPPLSLSLELEPPLQPPPLLLPLDQPLDQSSLLRRPPRGLTPNEAASPTIRATTNATPPNRVPASNDPAMSPP